MKSDRQAAIIELISRFEIETQEDMIEKLREMGFDVTQATVSRDIRELSLSKVQSSSGGYKYVKSGNRQPSVKAKINTAVVDSITSVDYAENIIVLKTYPGLGMAVASGVDALNLPMILGCIGGDDTIMIVTRDRESAKDLSENIHDIMKSL